MRVEIREYYIIVRSMSGVIKAWTPYDPHSGYTYDLEKLPRRAKFGLESKAAQKLADVIAANDAMVARYRQEGSCYRIPIDRYAAVEFKIAKVAITVDLLPQ